MTEATPIVVALVSSARSALPAVAEDVVGSLDTRAMLAEWTRSQATRLALLEAGGEVVAPRALAILGGPIIWVAGALSLGASLYFQYKSSVWEEESARRIGAIILPGAASGVMTTPGVVGESMREPVQREKLSVPAPAHDSFAGDRNDRSQKIVVQGDDAASGMRELTEMLGEEEVTRFINLLDQNFFRQGKRFFALEDLLGAFHNLFKLYGQKTWKIKGLYHAIIAAMEDKSGERHARGFIIQLLVTDRLMRKGVPIVSIEKKVKLPPESVDVESEGEDRYRIVPTKSANPETREDALDSAGVSYEIKSATRQPLALVAPSTAPADKQMMLASRNARLLKEVLRMKTLEDSGLRTGSVLIVVGSGGIESETVAVLLGLHPNLEVRHYPTYHRGNYEVFRMRSTTDGKRIIKKLVTADGRFLKALDAFKPYPIDGNLFFIRADLEIQERERRFYESLAVFFGLTETSPSPLDPSLVTAELDAALYFMGERGKAIRTLEHALNFKLIGKEGEEAGRDAILSVEQMQSDLAQSGEEGLPFLRRLNQAQAAPLAQWQNLLRAEWKSFRRIVTRVRGYRADLDLLLGSAYQRMTELEESTVHGTIWNAADADLLETVEQKFQERAEEISAALCDPKTAAKESPDPVPSPEGSGLAEYNAEGMKWLIHRAAQHHRKSWTSLLEHSSSITQVASRTGLFERNRLLEVARESLRQSGIKYPGIRSHLSNHLEEIERIFQDNPTGAPRHLVRALVWLSRIGDYLNHSDDLNH